MTDWLIDWFSEVVYLIGLFPGLLPDNVRDSISYSADLLSVMSDADRKQGLVALTKFLSEVFLVLLRLVER